MTTKPFSMDRREFIAMTAPLLSAVAAGGQPSFRAVEPKAARVALEKLADGNRRFAAGKTRHAHASADWRKHLLADQKPFATILGCSDSRVPPELVFDQGFGDLFVVRVAGNVVAPDILGSLGYALEHLGTQLIVVLGHLGCGAVTAALEGMADPSRREVPSIRELLRLIEPGLRGVDLRRPTAERVAAGVEANVRWSVRQLARHPAGQKLLAAKKLFLIGGTYDLRSGLVRFLDGLK